MTSSRAEAEHAASVRTRRRRTVLGLLVAGLVTTTLLGTFAVTQRAAADDQAQQARARDLAGQAELAIGEDPERAVMLALTAMHTTHTPLPEAVSALQTATQADRVVTTVDDVVDQAFAARVDGSLVVVDRTDAAGFSFIDAGTGKVTNTIATSRPPGWHSLAFDPSGLVLGVGYQAADPPKAQPSTTESDEPVVEQFDVPGGRSLGTLSGPPGSYESLAYSASGRWLAAVRHIGDAYTVVAWDLATPGAPIVLGPGIDFRFLPGTDDLVAAELGSPTLTIYDLAPDGDVHEGPADPPARRAVRLDGRRPFRPTRSRWRRSPVAVSTSSTSRPAHRGPRSTCRAPDSRSSAVTATWRSRAATT